MNSEYILLIMSFIFMVYGFRKLFPYIISRKWVSQVAKIVSIKEHYSEISSSEYQNIKYFFPIIKYVYKVDGVQYFSDKVCFDNRNIWVPEVDVIGNQTELEDKFWSGWLEGTEINIYFNPKNPSSAVIINKPRRKVISHNLSIIISGVTFLVIFFWLL